MAVNLELYLPPGYTTEVQLYARVGGAAVGSPVAGVPDGGDPSLYVFALGTPAIGDYDIQLSGVSTPNGPRIPMRVTATTQYYLADHWYILDATVVAGVVIPPSGSGGMCNVLFVIRAGATPLENATITAFLEDRNNTIDNVIISRGVITDVTDVSGMVTLELIRFVTFTSGGIYRIQVTDENGKIILKRRVKVPNTSSANMEDLEEAA